MKEVVFTVALAAVMAASVSANSKPGNVAASPDAAATPSPLIGVWCWTMNLGQAQLEVYSVTGTSFAGQFLWIGPEADGRDVAGKVEGNRLDFWSSRATHYNLTLKNDVLAGEDYNNDSGNTHWVTFKRGGCRPLS